jgi:FtsZ-binding cell division protein ZapB
MSEKRFQKTRIVDKWGGIYDSKTDKILDVNDVEHKLNEQQSAIQFLQDEIDELKKDIDIYEYEEKKHSKTARKLYEENEQLRKELKELENNYKDLLYDGGFDE